MKENLRKLFLFKNCDIDIIDSETGILKKVRKLTYSKNDIILDYDTVYRGIYTVYDGNAAVISAKSNGTVLRNLTRNDTFGAASVFSTDELYNTSVIALTDCSLLFIEREICEELVTNYPECAKNLIEFLSGRIAFLNRKITAFSAGNAEEKTAIWILSLPTSDDGSKVIESYSEGARSLCLGRASLYRALDALEDKGYIKRNSKSITVIDEKALSALF